MAPAGHSHGREGNKVNVSMSNHVYENDLGETYLAETGFILARSPDHVLAPDVAFVRKERAEAARDVPGFFPGVADLAVEVMSPRDRHTYVAEKASEWLEAGASIVIVVNPRNRTVQVSHIRWCDQNLLKPIRWVAAMWCRAGVCLSPTYSRRNWRGLTGYYRVCSMRLEVWAQAILEVMQWADKTSSLWRI